jgi:alpha-1,3-rhamnosyl/mannosyltransferase
MRVAITVDPLCGQLGGIGRYTLELIKGLKNRPGIGGLRYYLNGRWIADPMALLDGREILEPPPRWVPKQWEAQFTQWRRSGLLFHGTNFFLPPEARVGVITVHDLSVLRFPELHPIERIRAYQQQFDSSLTRTAHVITPSETMRREVIDMLGCAPDGVTAIPLAAPAAYRPRADDETRSLLSSFGLEPGEYGLSVGTIEPRKKLAQTLAAWEQLPPAVRRRWPLVVIGGEGWENDGIRSQIMRGEAQGWVRNLGYVPETSLPVLYSGARVVVYPSSYEGFGLPAVEAMASGVPCIVSKHSCLVEITQGAAMQVEPDDIMSFASDIERGLTDDAWRIDAINDGLRVAAGYSWEKCVSRTHALYKRVFAEAH